MGYTTNNTNCCDRCQRALDGKGWIEISGMKICGICQFETEQKNKPYLPFGAFKEWENENDKYWNNYLK